MIEPRVKDLTADDADRLRDAERLVDASTFELGSLRIEFLEREAQLVQRITKLQDERASLLSALGRTYLKGEEPGKWRFIPNVKAFVEDVNLNQEQNEDHGNNNQSS